MAKKEIILYTATLAALIIAIYLFSSTIFPSSGNSNNDFKSLTANVILDVPKEISVGDKLTGAITLTQEESEAYGVLLLTKGDKSLVAKTFNLKDLPRTPQGSGYSIDMKDLLDYTFEEQGTYELMFSVLDLDINVKQEFIVK